MLANPEAVSEAMKLLASAKRPLVIVGKGAAYGRAEDQVNNFITRSGLPFLPTPMGNICYIVQYSVIVFESIYCCSNH